ncbi:hypothetical protein JJB07_21290 [Tumebacillus sp. ITR2]|uniref:Uncharacterized protein n=1 Tax=Tumebacillus amylolyticus TaxID=2801339 RepID=A0ABS1JFU9_9BACL|nr:hypothetical protein [Tumebacillus amylolyticus]MBL0389133.1 hypothetical protein [Tumebacillus amylolyticus]
MRENRRIVVQTERNTVRVSFQVEDPVEVTPLHTSSPDAPVLLQFDPAALKQLGATQLKISRTVAFLIGLYAAM